MPLRGKPFNPFGRREDEQTSREFTDPVTGATLDDPEPKSFEVDFESRETTGSAIVDSLTEQPNETFFETRLSENRMDTPDDVSILGFNRVD